VITSISTAMVLSLLNLSSLATGKSMTATDPMTETSVLDFTMKSIDDTDVPLSTYRGKVLLIVNVASRCGNTPQYEGLQRLYETYHERGFEVLGFPANNFLGQEPGTNADIKEFCSTNYGVTFPMFSKISVRGSDQHPLYRYLTSDSTNPKFSGKVKWNFQKYLINRDGEVIAKFAPGDEPMSADVVSAIEAALTQKASTK
jgi:glutathione peroxidase